jgi:hypothetical protein
MKGLSYSDVYKNLDGMTALTVATSMPLRKHKGEKDTAFVKRIVACYLTAASRNGAHDDADSSGHHICKTEI